MGEGSRETWAFGFGQGEEYERRPVAATEIGVITAFVNEAGEVGTDRGISREVGTGHFIIISIG
jgi:hypothetical protein